jgi:hypothetical protein
MIQFGFELSLRQDHVKGGSAYPRDIGLAASGRSGHYLEVPVALIPAFGSVTHGRVTSSP